MEKKFIIPSFKRKFRPSGVYRITFDGSYFYIGSASDLRRRFLSWKTVLRQGINKNKRIREIYKQSIEVRFEVVEFAQVQHCKSREGYYIKENWENPLLLNYCQDPNSCYGIKFDDKDLALRKKSTYIQPEPRRPIAVFNMRWELIAKFEFLSQAALMVGSHRDTINEFLRGGSVHVKQYKFKLIANDGQYIEPKPFRSKGAKGRKPGTKIPQDQRERMKNAQRKRYERAVLTGQYELPEWAKAVDRFDKSGNFIERHPSVGDAARSVGQKDNSNIRKVLQGKKKCSIGGFTFRYAQ